MEPNRAEYDRTPFRYGRVGRCGAECYLVILTKRVSLSRQRYWLNRRTIIRKKLPIFSADVRCWSCCFFCAEEDGGYSDIRMQSIEYEVTFLQYLSMRFVGRSFCKSML